MSNMKFLSKNWIEEGTLTASTGAATVGLIKDRNVISVWQSIGSADGINEWVIDTWTAPKTINNICLREMNLRTFNVQYWDAGAAAYVDFTPAINEAANTLTSRIYEVNTVSTLRVRVQGTNTIIPGNQKRIGEFMAYFANVRLTEDYWPDSEDFAMYERKYEHEKMSGGSLIVYESAGMKFQNSYTFDALSYTYVVQLYSVKSLHQSFWFIPDDDDPLKQYYVNWTNDFNFQKVLAWDTFGVRCYSGNIEVKET